MKAFKKILLGLVGLIALLVIIGFMMPSKISLERAIVIDAPVEMIYDQVNNLHLWEKWSPWHKIDPNMELSYNNGGIGKDASYAWKSDHKSVGSGTLTISDTKPFEYINTLMDFGEQGTGTADFTFTKTEAGIEVKWNMHTDIGNNPIMRLFGPIMKKSVTKAYDSGLADIDTECQHLKETDWYYVKTKKKEVWNYYGITNEETTMETIKTTMEEFYGKLFAELSKAEIEIKGAPFAAYYTWGDVFKMECGLAVEDNSIEIKGLDQKQMSEYTYAVLKYTGSYDGLKGAHNYLMNWVKTYNYELAGPVLEKYKTDPHSEPNPEKWLTYILYPIK